MTVNAEQIDRHSLDVNALALALERAEFGIGSEPDPELVVPRTPGFVSAYPKKFFYDDHPAMAAYYTAARAEIDFVAPVLGRHPHKQLAVARKCQASSWQEVARRLRLRQRGYCDGGMRRLIGAQLDAEVADFEVCSIEEQIGTARRTREAARQGNRATLRKLGFVV